MLWDINIYKYICTNMIKNNLQFYSIMSNLHTHYHIKLDFQ